MRNEKKINVKCDDRRGIRHSLINIFLEEEPGQGRGELCSHYIYYVDSLADGKRVFLKRPARLNKGFDFEVHIENTNFGTARWRTMPSHKDIVQDLLVKYEEDSDEYDKLIVIIEKLYACEEVSDEEIRSLNFNNGFPVEAIVKSIKWLFIEQDVTYWNWSGRNMLYSHIMDQ